MREILKGVLILLCLPLVLALVWVPQTMSASTETFVNKSPDFILTVPMWSKVNSRHPASILRKALDPSEVTAFDVIVYDLPEGHSYKDIGKDMVDYRKDKYKALNFKILYEKEIKLSDGTPAYELELKWKHPEILLYTYEVVVFKDKKIIAISVTSDKQINDKLKEIPLSLRMK
jgi:hypothetical protein